MGKGTLILPLGVGGGGGAQGAQGATGMQGATGLQGYTGLQGIAGENGLQGFAGLQGAIGEQGVQGIQGASGGSSSSKIELLELTPEEQLQFYNDVRDRNIIDFSNYTANGYQLFNAYMFHSGLTIDMNEDNTYVTDGTEVALVMNPRYYCKGDLRDSESLQQTVFLYYTLFSPQIVMTYGGTIDLSADIIHTNSGGAGIQGIQGIAGENGIQGVQGLQGVAGLQGAEGATPTMQTVSLQFTLGDSSVVNYDFYIAPQQ